MFIFPRDECWDCLQRISTFKLWEGTKTLFSGFLCFALMGLSHKSSAFPDGQDGRGGVTPDTLLLQYYSISRFRISQQRLRPTSCNEQTHRKESLWWVYDALKLPNINISNCPFVCYSRRFLHAEAMHHSKMAERYAFVLFLDLRCIDLTWFNHNPCVTHHWFMHGSLLFILVTLVILNNVNKQPWTYQTKARTLKITYFNHIITCPPTDLPPCLPPPEVTIIRFLLYILFVAIYMYS